MPGKRIIRGELLERMRRLRAVGTPINTICSECHVSIGLVMGGVSDVVVTSNPSRGRLTHITAADVAVIRSQRVTGSPIKVLASRWHTSVKRIKGLLDGRINPDDASCEAESTPGPTPSFWIWPPQPVLDKAAFHSAQVPDTTANRTACIGHSRAWMHLYALRVLNPGYKDYGEPEHTVTFSHG